jgi:hypothetical protein
MPKKMSMEEVSRHVMEFIFLVKTYQAINWENKRGRKARIVRVSLLKSSQLWAIIKTIPSPTRSAPITPKIRIVVLVVFEFL